MRKIGGQVAGQLQHLSSKYCCTMDRAPAIGVALLIFTMIARNRRGRMHCRSVEPHAIKLRTPSSDGAASITPLGLPSPHRVQARIPQTSTARPQLAGKLISKPNHADQHIPCYSCSETRYSTVSPTVAERYETTTSARKLITILRASPASL